MKKKQKLNMHISGVRYVIYIEISWYNFLYRNMI